MEKLTQLRFDISEKVCLHPQNPGMDTLLELDLYPDVSIKDEGSHLKIHGYLRLNGTYLSEKDSEEIGQDQYTSLGITENRHELAYVIPVEITLPADRAEQGKISAEVETFDYQLLSPFELQIEAILLIDGLLPEKQEEEDEEAVHELPEGFVFSGESARPSAEEEKSEEEHKVQPQKLIYSDEKQPEQKDENSSSTFKAPKQEEASEPLMPSNEEESQPVEVIDLRVEAKEVDNEEIEEKKEIAKLQEEAKQNETMAPSPEEFWKQRQESKKMEQSKEAEENFLTQDENSDADITEDVENEENGRWVNWLLKEKEEQFTLMKMVIVQKDETIDHLASRYQVSVENILESNRLKGDRLEEGQILYVPVMQQSGQGDGAEKEEGNRG